MKLHHPAEERKLLRIAGESVSRQPLEAGDAPFVRPIFGYLIHRLVICLLLFSILGVVRADARADAWQVMLCALALHLVALVKLGVLHGEVTDANRHLVFANLPIPGEHVFRWARSRFLHRRMAEYLMVPLLCALALEPADLARFVAQAVMLAAVTFATTILIEDPWLTRLRIPSIWQWFGALVVVAGLFASIFWKPVFLENSIPSGVSMFLEASSWIYPATWVMPGRVEHGGALLAAAWCAWGAWRWMGWPRRFAPLFDQVGDFSAAPLEDEDYEDDWTERIAEPEEADDSRGPALFPAGADHILPAAPALVRRGWVERWIHRWIGPRDSLLLGTLGSPDPNYGKRVNFLLRHAVPVLLGVFAFHRWFPDGDARDILTVAVHLGFQGFLIMTLLPFTNALPHTFLSAPAGGRDAPLVSLLPVGMSEVLRASQRITNARCILMAAIGTPLLAAFYLAAGSGETARAVCGVVPAVSIFWAGSRPIFVWYRLQERTRPIRGAWPLVILQIALVIPLALAWFGAGVFATVGAAGLFVMGTTDPDFMFTLLSAPTALLASALGARGVFAIHYWMLQRGLLDWRE